MTPTKVIDAASRISGMPREDFTTATRIPKCAEIRHLAIWGIAQLPDRPSHARITALFGFRDTSNVGYSIKKAQDLWDTCPKFRRMRDQLETEIKASLKEVAA